MKAMVCTFALVAIAGESKFKVIKMIISAVILNIEDLSDEAVVYAKKINGRFESCSEVVLLELPEEDLDLSTKDISKKYCPGFEYFLEGFIVKEMVQDMRVVPDYKTVEQQVKRVIYYAEFDA